MAPRPQRQELPPSRPGGGGKRKKAKKRDVERHRRRMEDKPIGVPRGFDPPVPQDGREYRWRNGRLQVKDENGKWRVQEGPWKGVPHVTHELYRTGDEWRLAPQDSNTTLDLQIQLVNAGLLDPDDLPLEAGSWGSNTRAAFKELLALSNTSGRPWEETLMERTATLEELGVEPGSAGGERQPLTVELTSGEDLAALGTQAGQALTGKGMTPEEQMQFAAEYQGQERAVQEEAYGMAETGGVVTAPPDPGVAAEDFLRRRRPKDVAGYKAMEGLDIWNDLLASVGPRLGNSARV